MLTYKENCKMKRRHAFTLIELLIVVAIIAILAAIAVPNFLEAQVRAKVSRAKNDLRSMATGLEAYRIDQNNYPTDVGDWLLAGEAQPPRPLPVLQIPLLWVVTTPVAYMTSIPQSPFYDGFYRNNPENMGRNDYRYWGAGTWQFVMTRSPLDPLVRDIGKRWAVYAIGPDLVNDSGWEAMFGDDYFRRPQTGTPTDPYVHPGAHDYYDPTNGTASWGDIVRLGP